MNSKLRVALIGCGVISDNHISAVIGSEKAEIVAICDIDIARAEAKKRDYLLSANVYSDYREMLLNEPICL